MTDRLVPLPEVAVTLGVQRSTPWKWLERGVLPAPDRVVDGAPLWKLSTLVIWYERRKAETRPGWEKRLARAAESNTAPAGDEAYGYIAPWWDDPSRWIEGRELGERALIVVFRYRDADLEESSTAAGLLTA